MTQPLPRRQGMVRSLLGSLGFIETKGALANPEPWLLELFEGAAPSIAGPVVSPITAMTCAPVRCAVQAIAETVSQLPLMVYQRGENNSRERITDHPAYALLHDSANDWTPAATFIEQVARDALLQPHGGFAGSEDQAQLAFDEANSFVKATPALNKAAHIVESELELEHKASGSILRAKAPGVCVSAHVRVWRGKGPRRPDR